MNAGKLKHSVELWGNVKIKNSMNEESVKPDLIRKVKYVEIIPQTGSLQKHQGTDNQLSKVTHKAIIRYHAGKDIKQDQWFMFRGSRFDIRFILNPFFLNEKLEIFLEEVIE